MTITDGRRVRHELGPRRVWEFSNMRMLAATGMTGNGGWSRKMMTINPVPRQPRVPYIAPMIRLDDPCLECLGVIVTAHPSTAIYCGTRCRNKAAKRRQRAGRSLSA